MKEYPDSEAIPRESPLTYSKPDPEFNPYSPPLSDFQAAPDLEDNAPSETSKEPRYAGFIQRLLAFLLDGLIIYGFLIISAILAVILSLTLNDDLLSINLFNCYLFFQMIIFSTLYYVLQEASNRQATFGKRVMGIKVTNLDGGRIGLGQATGRTLGKILSAFFFFLGFLVQPFASQKQALHDVLAGTLVIDSRGAKQSGKP